MTMNLNNHFDRTINELETGGHRLDYILKLGEMLRRVKSHQIDESFAEFHNAAGKLPFAQDSDLGALLLEKMGDEESLPEIKERFYREACWRAIWCAKSATSGGEGLARSEDVKRLKIKETECTTISRTEPRVRGPVD